MSEYRPDQEAVDWARGCVQDAVKQFRQFEVDATARGEADRAKNWKRIAFMMEHKLIGHGCVIGPFNERIVQLQEQIDALRASS